MDYLDELKKIVGTVGYVDDAAGLEPYLREWRGHYASHAPIVLLPSSTRQVAELVSICAARSIGVIPQGGNTGLVGGAVAQSGAGQVIINLRRLDRVRRISAGGDYMIAEAGCVLADLQQAAADADRALGLSLSAEGSCQIGGNLATDAGGLNVLRYGTARRQVLGLEVVLADGRIWNGLRTLRKNTGGYDLRGLFVGSEGTLGIITAAALRLYPRPSDLGTALLALDGPGEAVPLLGYLRSRLANDLLAYELMSDTALELVCHNIPDSRSPFHQSYSAYVLVENAAYTPDGARPALEEALEAALGAGLIRDAVIATSSEQRRTLWRLRHSIPDAQTRAGASIKHDISLPIESIPAFLDDCGKRIRAMLPGVRLVVFGHVGDGSLHYNLSEPESMDSEVFRGREPELNRTVFDTIHAYGGSFSAEHGVGLLRRPELHRYVDDVEIDLMRRIKHTLDPHGILNPGKVL
ncbi:MAG TPA: FAD-binding oxidoreductase [Woeseiaceae bacterium]|nr:FAD-binding oxidoreductase [Woeseiaceae bacterium]